MISIGEGGWDAGFFGTQGFSNEGAERESPSAEVTPFLDPNQENIVARVSNPEPKVYNAGGE